MLSGGPLAVRMSRSVCGLKAVSNIDFVCFSFVRVFFFPVLFVFKSIGFLVCGDSVSSCSPNYGDYKKVTLGKPFN